MAQGHKPDEFVTIEQKPKEVCDAHQDALGWCATGRRPRSYGAPRQPRIDPLIAQEATLASVSPVGD
ncbi:hypothetical protein [Mesorhizobium sp. LNJC399B00]|uniref:hypothetical protein n=1 Tax=unclassified Mesorhizobium TaxID=325217 RepID=UPI0032AFC45A